MADEDLNCVPCDNVVQDDEGEASQIHRALPEPKSRRVKMSANIT